MAFDVLLTGNRIEDNLFGVFIDATFGAVDATGIAPFFNNIAGNDDGVFNDGDSVEGEVNWASWLRRPIDHPSRR